MRLAATCLLAISSGMRQRGIGQCKRRMIQSQVERLKTRAERFTKYSTKATALVSTHLTLARDTQCDVADTIAA